MTQLPNRSARSHAGPVSLCALGHGAATHQLLVGPPGGIEEKGGHPGESVPRTRPLNKFHIRAM
jgi:hypothetical protein